MDDEYLNELAKLKQNLGSKKFDDEEAVKGLRSITDSVHSKIF